MRARLRDRLIGLYGQQLGAQAALELERLLDGHRRPERLGSRPPSLFDYRDAVVISYGDSLLAPAQPPLASLRDFAARHLDGLVSTLHILPFFPYSSDYGFSVADYLRVNPELGDWDDVAALRRRFKLMFDFVLNHISAESGWFQAFLRSEPPYDRFFIVEDPSRDLSAVTRPRTTPLLTRFETQTGPRYVWTTFSADQVDLDYANPSVLLRMIDVMLTYVERGADLLRLDAVGYLWKEPGTSCIHLPQTHEVVKLLRDVLDEVAPSVAIVTETNVPHADNVAYFGNGHDEAQMVYQFPLAPLVLDAFARADASTLAAWAATLSPPSPATTFFNFLASHDGIGVVPARGLLDEERVRRLVERTLERGGQVSYKRNPDGSESPYELNITLFDALASPPSEPEPWPLRRDRFTCSQAILLALAGVPGIYVHSLFGTRNDYQAYARSGWKRDLNHARITLPELESRLANPASETAQIFAAYRRLLAARRVSPAFHPASPQQVLPIQPDVFALRRGPWAGESILAVHNLSSEPQSLALGRLAEREEGPFADLIGGEPFDSNQSIQLAPYGVLWLRSPSRP